MPKRIKYHIKPRQTAYYESPEEKPIQYLQRSEVHLSHQEIPQNDTEEDTLDEDDPNNSASNEEYSENNEDTCNTSHIMTPLPSPKFITQVRVHPEEKCGLNVSAANSRNFFTTSKGIA